MNDETKPTAIIRKSMEKPNSRVRSLLTLARVKAGESLLITERGRAVAVLEPLGWDPTEDEALTAIVLEGLASPPERDMDVDRLAKRWTMDPRTDLEE